ncbi:hypothetical protein [Kocuria sp. U4B]
MPSRTLVAAARGDRRTAATGGNDYDAVRASEVVLEVAFTDPEIAAVGLTSADGPGTTVRTADHVHLDRAITEDDAAGSTRLVLDPKGRILGGTVAGPRAGESIGELALAVHRGPSTGDLASVTRPYPTCDDGIWNAAALHEQAGKRLPWSAVGVAGPAGS